MGALGVWVEIVLLGAVGARSGGAEVDVGVRKHRFVLALLALEANSAVATDRIVDVVWRDGPPRSARRMVHGIVSGLRSALSRHAADEEVRLVSEGDGYALHCDPLRVDAHRFRALLRRARTAGDDARRLVALDEALALWRGPALAGITTNGVRDVLSSGLEEARLGAVEDRLEARRRLGLPAAVDELLDLHRAHPHRPRLVEHLMLALHRAGRTPEALEVYRRARTSLARDHGLDVSGDVERLHLAILRGETEQRPHAEVAVPAQLPADLAGLAGRDQEVKALVRTVSAARGEPAVCAVDGMAGVGKTALSVRAAHHLGTRFPGGLLFLDLHGFTSGRAPVTPLDALRHLLGSFGVHDVPGDVDSAAARWRSLTAGRRVLLVLDNASGDEQVVPLLPGGAGCAVVITSRRRLTAGGRAVPLSLEPLSPAASGEVFRTAAALPATAQVGEVTTLCGGLPLALRTAANRLRNRPLWTVEDLASLLSDPAHVVAELRLLHAFDSSLAALDVHSRRAHSLLARCAPARFGTAEAAALLDLPPRQAHRLLEQLVDLHLLVVDGADGYSFHDLVRLHAAL
ncbi:BTAD domain-containing putative transcriptional regulator [Lentzea sp. NPDC058436]|uniref:AfsR/SARP family transcriptional regulator n=1 Tax=Lentzea sp. NPDC058436 TaxID=3346499 RepID=UPI00364DF7A6